VTWVKLDDQFFTHPRAVRAGKNGRSLFLAGLCWCKNHLTDGVIPKGALPLLAAQADVPGRSTAKALEGVGLWHDMGDHWLVNDWEQHQESGDVERERKRKKAERMAKWRATKASRNADVDAPQDAPRDGHVPSPDTDTDTDTSYGQKDSPPSHALPRRDTAEEAGGDLISLADALRGRAS
jgi:hypothetical protein